MKVPRITKDEYYLKIALTVSLRSTCLKRQYGCVIVNNDEIIATGYNGSPRNEINCCDIGNCKRLNVPNNSGQYDDCHSVHAEQNAMLSAARRDMIGATMYLVGFEYINTTQKIGIHNAEPCPICKRMAMNAGIKRIVNEEGEICLQ